MLESGSGFDVVAVGNDNIVPGVLDHSSIRRLSSVGVAALLSSASGRSTNPLI